MSEGYILGVGLWLSWRSAIKLVENLLRVFCIIKIRFVIIIVVINAKRGSFRIEFFRRRSGERLISLPDAL